VFRQPATIGAVFIAVLILGGEMVGSATIRAFVTQSPLVTIAAGLGIGALLEFVGGAILGKLVAGNRARPALVRQLPEFQEFWAHTRWNRDVGVPIGLRRDDIYGAIAQYHIRRHAPGPLIDYVASLRDRAKDAFLVSWTVTLAVILLTFLQVDPGSFEMLIVSFLFVLVASEITQRTLKDLLIADELDEQFLRETAKGVAPLASEWSGRTPPALPPISYFGPSLLMLRFARLRLRRARHRWRRRRANRHRPL
jgi:hypothetical protein